MAPDYAVVIVGGGTAGCVLAARLSADGERRVLVVEAGRDVHKAAELPPVLVGHPPLSAAELPDTWRYAVELVKAPARRMGQSRGRVLGGSSSINGSLFVRGVPEDYDSWGSPLWSFDAVLPFFRKSETDLDFRDQFHGAEGPLNVSRACDQALSATQQRVYDRAVGLGIKEKADLNHPLGSGIGRLPMTSDSRSTALTYLAPQRRQPNLAVLTDALVTRVVVENGRAVGVEGVQADRTFIVRAPEIILSCGTFGSAELLLRSGIGPAGPLQALGIACVLDRPGVGQNLRCHPMLTLHFEPDQDGGVDPDSPRLALVLSTRARNDLMLFPKQTADDLAIMTTLRLPLSAGELRLRSAEPRVPPEITYGYLDAGDLDCLREGTRWATELAQRQPLERVTDGWIVDRLETADHACGTCKLGSRDDPLAVVDDTCGVHGLPGLRVVDLSIVPRPVRAGPYPTVVMLAERAAELIVNARPGG
jgi:choline dehydrogenase